MEHREKRKKEREELFNEWDNTFGEELIFENVEEEKLYDFLIENFNHIINDYEKESLFKNISKDDLLLFEILPYKINYPKFNQDYLERIFKREVIIHQRYKNKHGVLVIEMKKE